MLWDVLEMLLDNSQLRRRHLEAGALGGRRMKNWDMSWNKFHQIRLISNVFCLMFAGSRRGWGYRTIRGTTAVQQHNIHIRPWTGGPCKTSDCWQANGQEVSNPKFWACGLSWFNDPRGSTNPWLSEAIPCLQVNPEEGTLGAANVAGRSSSQHVRNMWKHLKTSQNNRDVCNVVFSNGIVMHCVWAAILHWLSDSTDPSLIQDLSAITFSLSAFSFIWQFAFLKSGLNPYPNRKYNIIFFQSDWHIW